MITLNQLLSRFIVIDPASFYLASIPATLLQWNMLRKNEKYFKYRFGRKLNWQNPKRLSDKLNLFKISKEAEAYSVYADKYTVRSYVKETIGEKYMVPLYHVYSSVDEIDFESLPQSFVMRCNHGSGWNVLCPDKSKLDWEAEKKKLNEWLHSNYYSKYYGERQYRIIPPRIVCEEFIHTPEGTELLDYKIHCFNGNPEYIKVLLGHEDPNIKRATYDLKWEKSDIEFLKDKDSKPYPHITFPRPDNLEEMGEIARKLAKPFPYVRVDLYNVGNKVYFGELTFTPNAGFNIFYPDYYDEKYGEMVNFP